MNGFEVLGSFMGTFGFSYIGLLFLLMLFIPNSLWTKRKPEGYAALEGSEPRPLLALERVGQVLVTATALCFSDFNFHEFSLWTLWLAAAFALLVLYDICWWRYLSGEHTLAAFYGDRFGIPVPLATLPVTAFFLLGIYGKVVWLVVSSVILGVGHIGIHLMHRRTVLQPHKN